MKRTAKILLVDDEPGMLRYIKTLLEVDDYKVETATTGEEALHRVEKGLEPDLVLLDVLMPGIDGLQTLEQLRQKQPSMKVIMLSCVSDTRKVVQAMKLGAQDYLTKPFQKAELDAVIDLSLGEGKQNFGGEVEELAEDVFFVAASPAMRKIRLWTRKLDQTTTSTSTTWAEALFLSLRLHAALKGSLFHGSAGGFFE